MRNNNITATVKEICRGNTILRWGVINISRLKIITDTYISTSRFYSAPIDPFTVLEINTKEITTFLTGAGRKYFKRSDSIPEICSGDWDERVVPLASTSFYIALRERVVYGQSWDKIEWINECRRTIQNGKPKFGCNNVEDFRERLTALDKLSEKMAREGLHPQWRVAAQCSRVDFWDSRQPLRPPENNEIVINFGRVGQHILHEGRHRVALAHLLDLPIIPCRVKVRHTDWQELREDIAKGARVSVQHPDLYFG